MRNILLQLVYGKTNTGGGGGARTFSDARTGSGSGHGGSGIFAIRFTNTHMQLQIICNLDLPCLVVVLLVVHGSAAVAAAVDMLKNNYPLVELPIRYQSALLVHPGPAPISPAGNGNDGGNTTLVTPGGTFTAYGGGNAGGNNLVETMVALAVAVVLAVGGGNGNKVTGTQTSAQTPPQPQVLTNVQGYAVVVGTIIQEVAAVVLVVLV